VYRKKRGRRLITRIESTLLAKAKEGTMGILNLKRS